MNRVNYTTLAEINETTGFFTRYKALFSERFILLFGDITSSEITDLDNLLTDIYGDRYIDNCYQIILDTGGAVMDRIIKRCNSMLFDGWQAVKTSIDKVLSSDVEKPLKSSKTVENTSTNNENSFDSSTANEVSNNVFSGTETTTYSNGKTPAENATKLFDFVKYNDFLQIILKDVADVATLNIL